MRGYQVVDAPHNADQGFEHKGLHLLATGSGLQGAMRLLQGASTVGNAGTQSGRGCWIKRPAADVTEVARLSLACVIFCFHHHANTSAFIRAAQWPALSPDMTGLTAAGANPLLKGRVPAHPMGADECSAPYCLNLSLSPTNSHVGVVVSVVTPLPECLRVFLFCGPGCKYDCLSCTPILLRLCLTCFFLYISTALTPTNNPNLDFLLGLDRAQTFTLLPSISQLRLSAFHEPFVPRAVDSP